MLDPMDYKEPACSLCGGEEFYNPKKDAPTGKIPILRIIDKLDGLFEKNDLKSAGELLRYWEGEALALNDKQGLIAIYSEMMGYYRKTLDKENGLKSVKSGLKIIEELAMKDSVSSATVILNAATTYKAFGFPEKALPLYEHTLKTYKKYLQESDARFGGLYNNFGLTLMDLKKYKEAEEMFNKALLIMQNIDQGQLDMAITKVNLANLYEAKSESQEKINALMEDAYALLNSDKLKRNGYYAFVCEKLAPAFIYYGYFVIEKELKLRAKEIYERT